MKRKKPHIEVGSTRVAGIEMSVSEASTGVEKCMDEVGDEELVDQGGRLSQGVRPMPLETSVTLKSADIGIRGEVGRAHGTRGEDGTASIEGEGRGATTHTAARTTDGGSRRKHPHERTHDETKRCDDPRQSSAPTECADTKGPGRSNSHEWMMRTPTKKALGTNRTKMAAVRGHRVEETRQEANWRVGADEDELATKSSSRIKKGVPVESDKERIYGVQETTAISCVDQRNQTNHPCTLSVQG
ncbi:hypothetical protein OG21DRAFT_1524505 [Imleria badia]|nr:hypothetical protein OG21DRAFT_1524505 [Imleria badia]